MREKESIEVDPRLLEILACPGCGSPVRDVGEFLHCEGCRRRYPVRSGIPVMLVDESEPAPRVAQ